MNIKQEKYNDIIICILEGEININTSPELRKTFNDIVNNNHKKVLVDLAGVSYIDSSGLATLIEIMQRLKKVNGKIRFSDMSEKVRNIFEITKLIKLFEIFDSRQEALRDF
ncbi:MAG: STAS domain-containing protein [Candidatus Omnitrophota bacterium]